MRPPANSYGCSIPNQATAKRLLASHRTSNLPTSQSATLAQSPLAIDTLGEETVDLGQYQVKAVRQLGQLGQIVNHGQEQLA